MTEAGGSVVDLDGRRSSQHLPDAGPGQEQPGEVLEEPRQLVHLDVEAPRDVAPLLQQPAVLQQHAGVHRDVHLLRREEDVHEVDVLGRGVARAGHHQQSRTVFLRLMPRGLQFIDVTQGHGHGSGQ